MTESDAKEKWCPESRVAMSNVYKAYNRDVEVGEILPECTCLASNCMMWRWFPVVKDDGKGTYKADRGYCGLSR